MASTEAPTLVAADLVTGYRVRRGEQAVSRASVTVPAGTIAAVIGPNGVGKTTLLKTLVGLLPPLSGTVTIGGLPTQEHRRRRGIGYLPEQLTFPSKWSVRGMLALAALAAGNGTAEAIPHAVALAGVDFDLGRRVDGLSKGMRQRLGLAMALVPVPGLLLLDEPEAGLDPAQRIRLRDALRAFAREGRTVLLASHDVSGVCTVADQTYLMRPDRMDPVTRADLGDPHRITQLFEESRR